MEDDFKSAALNLHQKAEELLANKLMKNGSTRTQEETLRLIHELEVHQIELEMQKEELDAQKAAIQDEKDISELAAEKYKTFYDFATTDYYSINREGEIKELNLSAARKLGKERSKLINSQFGFFLTEESKLIFNLFLEMLFNDSQKAACELSLLTPDKRTVYYHVTGIHSLTEQLCFLSAIDISERKETEKFREMKREILQILNETETIKNAVHQTLTILKSYTGFDAIGIRLQDNNDFPYLDQSGFSNEFLLSENSILEFDNHGNVCRDKKGNPRLGCTCGLVISGKANKSNPFFTAGGSWWTNDSLPILNVQAKEDARFRPRNVCIHDGYASVALVPIRNNSTVVGLIQFNDKRTNCFTPNTIEVLEGIASHIGAAIMRKQAEDTLRKNEEFLRTITENAPDIIIELDREGNIQYMNRTMPGYEMEECLGRHFTEWTLAEYHELMYRSLRLVFEEGETQTFLSQSKDKNGKIHWHRSSISPVKDGTIVKNAIKITRDITDSIITEEILKDSEEKLNAIILSAMDGFWITDGGGHFLEVNDTYCQMSGYIRSELMTMRIQDVEVKEQSVDTISHIQRIVEQGHDRFESQHRKKDGSFFDVEVSVQFKPVDGGRFVSFLHDISERKQKDILLLQSEERFRNMANAIPQLAWMAHADGFIYWYNQRWYDYTGTNPEQMEGWGWQQVHDPEVLPGVLERWKNSIESGESFEMEFPLRGADGIFRTFLTRVMPLKDSEGRITQWFGTNTDVSEIKQAETALKLLSKELEIIIDSIQGLVFYKDVNNHYLRVNKYMADAYHMSKKQLEGIDLNELHTKEQAQAYYDADLRVIKSRIPELNFDEPWDTENGLRWVNTSKVPYIDNSGEVVGVIGVSIDITERKLAEQTLQESEQRYKSLFQDNYSVMLLIQPETGEILDANPTACKYYGWSKEEMCTRKISDINTLSSQEVAAEMQKAKEEERNHFFFRHRLATGEIRDVEVYSGPIRFGDTTMLYSLVHDITDRKIAEEALSQSEERYKSLFQGNQSIMIILNPDTGEIVDVNPAACNFYGWSHSELCQKTIYEIDPVPKEETALALKKSKVKKSNHLTLKHRLANGEVRDVEVYSGPIQFGESTLLYSIIHDITEIKFAQEALQKSEQKLSEIY